MTPVIALVIGGLWFLYPHISQMRAGKKYMDSLTTEDIQQWIEHSKEIWSNPELYDREWQSNPPEDLKKLKILRVDVFDNKVFYVWMGGFDHTYLVVEREDNGQITVWARYWDGNSERAGKMLWPTSKD